MKLNLGCGSVTPDAWINVDYAFGAWMAKIPLFKVVNRKLRLINLDWDRNIVIHDIRKRFPWPDESCAVIYSSHTLEHLSREEGGFFLSECRRVLKKDGILRLVVPDLREIVSRYMRGEIRADMFLEKMEVFTGMKDNSLKSRMKLFIQSPHKCMYDEETLLGILAGAGFHARTREAFDSEIEDINVIEIEDRTKNAVIIEAQKD